MRVELERTAEGFRVLSSSEPLDAGMRAAVEGHPKIGARMGRFRRATFTAKWSADKQDPEGTRYALELDELVEGHAC